MDMRAEHIVFRLDVWYRGHAQPARLYVTSQELEGFILGMTSMLDARKQDGIAYVSFPPHNRGGNESVMYLSTSNVLYFEAQCEIRVLEKLIWYAKEKRWYGLTGDNELFKIDTECLERLFKGYGLHMEGWPEDSTDAVIEVNAKLLKRLHPMGNGAVWVTDVSSERWEGMADEEDA